MEWGWEVQGGAGTRVDFEGRALRRRSRAACRGGESQTTCDFWSGWEGQSLLGEVGEDAERQVVGNTGSLFGTLGSSGSGGWVLVGWAEWL